MAIVGYSDAVGANLVTALRQRQFPLSALTLYAPPSKVGTVVKTQIPAIGDVTTVKYSLDSVREADVVFLATDETFSAANALYDDEIET